MERRHDHQATKGAKHNILVFTAHYDMPDRRTVGFDQPSMNDLIRLLPDGTIGDKIVVFAAQIERIDLIERDKAIDANGLLIGRPHVLNLFAINNDVMAFGVFVSGYDILVWNFAVNWASFLILNAAFAFGVELVKAYTAGPAC